MSSERHVYDFRAELERDLMRQKHLTKLECDWARQKLECDLMREPPKLTLVEREPERLTTKVAGPLLVAVTGQAGSGKSAVANALQQRHGFKIVGFADPLKKAAQSIFGFTDAQLWGPSSSRSIPHPYFKRPDGSPLTPRFALQQLGTDFARACCLDVWVQAALNSLDGVSDVVIPDCRFVNEMDAVRARGGIVIRRSTDKLSQDMHPSERELAELPDDAFDVVIPQYASLDALGHYVDGLVAGWRTISSQGKAA